MREPITCQVCGRRMIAEFCCTMGEPFCHQHCKHEKNREGKCCELVMNDSKKGEGMNFRMEFDTNISREEAILIIRQQNEKDKREAEIIIKIMEGKASDLGYLRKKIAGEILSNIQKIALNEEQKFWILSNMKQRVEKGTEQLISCENGKLVVEFDEFGKMGSDYLKRTKHAEKQLMKRFKASDFRYLPNEKQEVSP